MAPLLQDSAGHSKPQASPSSRGGKSSKAKLPGSRGTMNIIIHSRADRGVISACIHTLSVSPLNSRAFKELKILFTFVTPGATPMVLSVQWVFTNKFSWIN